MGKVQKEAEQLAENLGFKASETNKTVEEILREMGGQTRNKIPKKTWGYTLFDLCRSAIEGDADAITAKKILSQQKRLHSKNHPA
jgi:hypothetical protein